MPADTDDSGVLRFDEADVERAQRDPDSLRFYARSRWFEERVRDEVQRRREVPTGSRRSLRKNRAATAELSVRLPMTSELPAANMRLRRQRAGSRVPRRSAASRPVVARRPSVEGARSTETTQRDGRHARPHPDVGPSIGIGGFDVSETRNTRCSSKVNQIQRFTSGTRRNQ